MYECAEAHKDSKGGQAVQAYPELRKGKGSAAFARRRQFKGR